VILRPGGDGGWGIRPGQQPEGDSLLIDAEQPVTRARVTAAPGTTLHFICVIHPWMQGKLRVT
jgi:hypothetical protein